MAGSNTLLRGHEIEEVDGVWCYVDTGEPVAATWRDRPCGHCGEMDTPEGHDACLGTLPGVMNACCGHGDPGGAYVQYEDGSSVHGAAAVVEMRAMAEPHDR